MIKTKSKKILSLVLTLCMVLSLLPLNAFAAVTGGPSELDTLKVGNTTIESVTGNGSEIDAYKATAYVSDYNDVKLSITLTEKDSAKLYYKASETESISADEISTEITLNSGSASDQAITGLSSTNKYLLLKLDMEGSSSDYKYFVITVEKAAAPVISAEATITAGNEGATVALTADQNFNSSVTTGDFTVDVGETGLVFSSVSSDGDTNATLTFTGTAAEGTIKITAKTTAFNPNASADSNEATVTVGPKTEAGKTDKPQIKGAEDTATVMCEDGNTKAVLELTNTYTGEVKVTVKNEQGDSAAENVTGSYAEGKITLNFEPALDKETTYQISVQEGDKTVSDPVKVTVKLYAKPKTDTPTPEAQGETYEITAAEGDESAVIPLTNSYEGAVTVTVKTAENGEATGVTGEYTKEPSQITLTFSPKLDAKTTYKISVTEEGKDESEQVEVTVNPYPVTADPVINPNKVTAEADNKSAIFNVTNASDYTGKEVTVKIYDQEGTEVASDVTAAYKDGKLTLTYTEALAKETSYKVEFDTADSAPSGKVDITVTPVKATTATPEVDAEGEVTVYCDSSENTTAKVTLLNGHLYTGTPTVTVYKEGQKVESDPTASYAEGVITLTFTTPVSGEEGQTYEIALTEEGKNESEKLTVTVMPYQSSTNATIGSIVGTFGESDYTAEADTENSGDGSAPTKAQAYVLNLPEGTEITSGTVKLTVDPKATVSYLASATELEGDESFTGEENGDNQDGTVTISSLNFDTNKYLYVKVVAEDKTTTTYYVITVKETQFKAGTPTTGLTLGNTKYNEDLADLIETSIGEESQKTIGSAALNAAEANTALAAQMSNEGTFATKDSAPDSVWGKLYAANNSITDGTITYYYVPYLDINVPDGGYDADAKTLTVDITPKYEVVASTASTYEGVKLDTDINGVVISTDNTLTGLENITVELKIPTEIAADGATVYVQHKNDGWNAYTVSSGTVEVVAPSFSNFYIRGTAPGEAMIGTKVYNTVQDAINALTNGTGQKITLLSNDAKVTDLTPPTNGCSSFTIENGTSVTVDLSTITFKSAVGKDGYTYTASNSNGTITVTWSKDYKVTISTSGSGTMTANPTTAAMGTKVTLTVSSGTVKNVTARSNGSNVNITVEEAGKTYSFIMPEGDVIVTAEFESSNPGGYTGGGGSGSSATVNSSKAINGSFAISDKNAKAGDTVKVTPKANEGYVVDTVTVTDKNGKNIPVTQNADGTYSFVMPEKSAQPVDVKVTFKLDDAEKDCPSEKFTDVDQDKWYHEGVDYAIKNGLMNGTGADTFAPDATTTRAMVVTILYRLDGEPAVTKDIPFADVPAGQWYSNAINWAAANGIVDGYGNGKFGPDDTITREQMAAILYRYASYKGYSVSNLANLTGYTDAASVSEWASTAMRWAVAEGLIEGTSATTLSPSGDSTRAQVATILMRFCEGVVK